MKRSEFRLWILGAAFAVPLLALLVIAVARPSAAAAHPLGNFTVNRYSRLELYSDGIRIRYVLDMAEIPTFQEMEAIDRDGDGRVSDAEKEGYAAQKAYEMLRGLHLSVDGSPVGLDVLSHELAFPQGQGGLSTLRLSLLLSALVSGSEPGVAYRDDNYADRIGWKEIVVRPAEGVTVLESSAAATDLSNELTAYPQDLLSSPLDVRQASFRFIPGANAPAPKVTAAAIEPAPETAPERAGAAFTSLIARGDLSLGVVVLSLLGALAFGALHALEPGHGKTFVAAYFVGVKGTAKHAILLGLVIAATHSLGVFAIGLVVLYGSNFVLPEDFYPWLGLASAIMVLGLGIRLLIVRLVAFHRWRRPNAASPTKPGSHVEPEHNHGRGPHLGHSHRATDESGSLLPWRSLLALGLADGLVPSPSTLVVLLAAVSLHRIGLGILLIVAFSVGLAAVLAAVSLALIYARRLLDWASGRLGPRLGDGSYLRRLFMAFGGEGRLPQLLPLGGAVVLIVTGALLLARASSTGVAPLVPLL